MAMVRLPIIKYTKALCTDDAPMARLIISTMAVKIPPRAWPPTTAVMYFGENLPTIPKRLPERIALETEFSDRFYVLFEIKGKKVMFQLENVNLKKAILFTTF